MKLFLQFSQKSGEAGTEGTVESYDIEKRLVSVMYFNFIVHIRTLLSELLIYE